MTLDSPGSEAVHERFERDQLELDTLCSPPVDLVPEVWPGNYDDGDAAILRASGDDHSRATGNCRLLPRDIVRFVAGPQGGLAALTSQARSIRASHALGAHSAIGLSRCHRGPELETLGPSAVVLVRSAFGDAVDGLEAVSHRAAATLKVLIPAFEGVAR